MFYKVLFGLLIFILFFPSLIQGEKLEDFDLLIECNTDSYTPGKDEEAKFICSIINNKDEEVNLDIAMTSDKFVIYGKGKEHRWPLHLWKYEEDENFKKDLILIKPREKAVIFEEFLNNLFFQREKLEKEEEAHSIWLWDWIAHPMPPESPIHTYRGEGYEESAIFWFILNIDGEILESNKVTLIVEE